MVSACIIVLLFNDRWRAYMILKPVSAAERPGLQLKIYAADALKGRRKDWGSMQKWEGNYLANVRNVFGKN